MCVLTELNTQLTSAMLLLKLVVNIVTIIIQVATGIRSTIIIILLSTMVIISTTMATI